MGRKSWLTAFSLLLLLGCGAGKREGLISTRPIELPEWFWKPPLIRSVPVAVGYSPSFLDPEKAIASAEENGVENLAKQICLRIKGERIFLKDELGIKFMGEKIEEIVPEEMLENLKRNHVLLDAFVSERGTIALVATKKIPVSHRTIRPGGRPKWLREIPREKGFLYATGQSQRGVYEVNSWLMAEREARVELAMSLKAKVRGLNKKIDAWSEGVFTSGTDITLEGIQIVERWYDPDTKMCHVLARVPLKTSGASASRKTIRR